MHIYSYYHQENHQDQTLPYQKPRNRSTLRKKVKITHGRHLQPGPSFLFASMVKTVIKRSFGKFVMNMSKASKHAKTQDNHLPKPIIYPSHSFHQLCNLQHHYDSSHSFYQKCKTPTSLWLKPFLLQTCQVKLCSVLFHSNSLKYASIYIVNHFK